MGVGRPAVLLMPPLFASSLSRAGIGYGSREACTFARASYLCIFSKQSRNRVQE